MKQIKSYIAVSLDGFIAPPDKELDWIPQEVKFLLNKEYEMADNFADGGKYLSISFQTLGWLAVQKPTVFCGVPLPQ